MKKNTNERPALLKHLKESGISKNIINAFSEIDQAEFFPRTIDFAPYSLKPVSIGCGQKSDDPFILSRMIQLLEPKKSWKLLEIGTGSGYSTALLSKMVKEVITIELNANLAKSTRKNLVDNGFFNIRIFAGDASGIDDSVGKFDGLIIHAACSQRPMKLLALLKNGSPAVFPMGPTFQQQIVRYINRPIDEESLRNFTFHEFCNVESIRGKYGWIDREYPPSGPADEEQPDQSSL